MKQASVGIVINKHRHVLLVTNRTYGGWSLPGGKCEGDERPGETLLREFIEEVDLQPCWATLLGSWPGTLADDYVVHVHHVARVSCHGRARAIEPNSAIKWVTFNTLAQDVVFGEFYRDHFPNGFDHLEITHGIK